MERAGESRLSAPAGTYPGRTDRRPSLLESSANRREMTDFPWQSKHCCCLTDSEGRPRPAAYPDRPRRQGSGWWERRDGRDAGHQRRPPCPSSPTPGSSSFPPSPSAVTAPCCPAEVAHLYNNSRTHLAIDKDAPFGRAVQMTERIKIVLHLVGLHNSFVRI